MPQYDGSIRIGTEITTKQAEKELKRLESSIEKTASEIASLRSKMDALKDVKIPTSEYKKLQNDLDNSIKKYEEISDVVKTFEKNGTAKGFTPFAKAKAEAQDLYIKIEDLRGELYSLEESGKAFTLGSDTEKYAQMSAQMQQLNQQMESDTKRQSELHSELAAEEERIAQIKANACISDEKILGIVERRKQLLAEIADLEAAGVGLGYKEYEDKNRELERLNEQIREYGKNVSSVSAKFERIKEAARKAFFSMSQSTKRSAESLNDLTANFKHGFKTVLKYAFGIRSLYVLFNKIRSGISEGFTNLMGYSDSFANSVQSVKNSMSTLGNQIAAAFSPIVQMVIPWLNSLISTLSTAITYVAQFIAALTGKSTFTKATQIQDKYNLNQ